MQKKEQTEKKNKEYANGTQVGENAAGENSQENPKFGSKLFRNIIGLLLQKTDQGWSKCLRELRSDAKGRREDEGSVYPEDDGSGSGAVGGGIQACEEDAKGDRHAVGGAGENDCTKKAGRPKKKETPELKTPCEILGGITLVFPHFWIWLSAFDDPRQKSRTYYPLKYILTLSLMQRLCGHLHCNSYEKLTQAERETLRRNVQRLCLMSGKDGPRELPDPDTCRNLMEKLDPSELMDLNFLMFEALRKRKWLQPFRTPGGMLHLVIDGVCFDGSKYFLEHSIKAVHNRGTEKEYTEYKLYALQAMLVSPCGATFCLMTEFLETADNFNKEDCERNAAKRLLEKLHKRLPRERFLIGGDGLFACQSLIQRCHELGMGFVFTFKGTGKNGFYAKSSKIAMNSNKYVEICEDTEEYILRWADGIKIDVGSKKKLELSVIRGDGKFAWGKGNSSTLMYITDQRIANEENGNERRNREAVDFFNKRCRGRWRIETSFNTQKNLGFGLEASYGRCGNAGQNYYLIVQIAVNLFDIMTRSNFMNRLQEKDNPGADGVKIRKCLRDRYGGIRVLLEKIGRSMISQEYNYDAEYWKNARLTFNNWPPQKAISSA